MLTLGQAVFWATRVVQWTKESPLPYKFPILTLSLDSKNVFPTWHLQLIPKAMIVFAPQLFLPGVSCHRWRHTIHPFLLATNLQAMIQLQLVNIHIYEQNGWCLTWKVLNIRDLKKKNKRTSSSSAYHYSFLEFISFPCSQENFNLNVFMLENLLLLYPASLQMNCAYNSYVKFPVTIGFKCLKKFSYELSHKIITGLQLVKTNM